MLDTSALLIWTLSPKRLPKAARAAISAGEQHGILASAISLWEIGLKAERGTLSLGVPFHDYVQRLQCVNALSFVPVDTRVWLGMLALNANTIWS